MTMTKYIAATLIALMPSTAAFANNGSAAAAPTLQANYVDAGLTAPKPVTRRKIKRVVKPITTKKSIDIRSYRVSCDAASPAIDAPAATFKSNMKVFANNTTASTIKYANIQKSCSPRKHTHS